jgi:TetR/AcrR family acrAB operon transcriptional repressor
MLHKCEAIDDMATARDRQRDNRNACLSHVEQGFANAIKKGQLPKSVNPRQAAIGMHALVDGLVTNWVLAPGYFSLTADGERIIDQYLEGLSAGSKKK